MKKSAPKPQKEAVNISDKSRLNDFLDGAERSPEAPRYPWQASSIDDQNKKMVNLRLPESYALKLDYLAKQRIPKTSKHHILLEKLLPAIDAELKAQGVDLD